jgi:hypothetical protein
MAWRPTRYLIKGELDNTRPGKVTGWMRFAGLRRKMTFDLNGDFHRDIRGAKIHFRGNGNPDDPEAEKHMEDIEQHQTGEVGDMTAGLPPCDYGQTPYLEWYGDDNGRVVIELEPEQVEVIGRPLPACESEPISRVKQQQNMAKFLSRISEAGGVSALAVGVALPIASDPSFSHWVIEQDRVVGEAHSVKPDSRGMSFAFVRLFSLPDGAEFGYIETARLRAKNGKPPA